LPQPLPPALVPLQASATEAELPSAGRLDPIEAIDPLDYLPTSVSAGRKRHGHAAGALAHDERVRRRSLSNAVMLVASTLFILAALAVLMYLTGK